MHDSLSLRPGAFGLAKLLDRRRNSAHQYFPNGNRAELYRDIRLLA